MRRAAQTAAPCGTTSSGVSRDEGLTNIIWQKAIALLDDRERRIDTRGCTLPEDPAAFFRYPGWELPGVTSHRAALNHSKGLLDDLDNTAWDRLAQTTNYAEYVRRDLRKQFQVELATVAWAKMYELIARLNLLPEHNGSPACGTVAPNPARTESSGRSSPGIPSTSTPSAEPCPLLLPPQVVTVHLCEAPGGFVAACNHFLCTHRPGWRWDWLAVSLNPYYGGNDQFAMVDDDAFMRATLPHWCFGADDSGDVRRPDNIRAIWAETRRRCAAAGVEGAMLVTADGAIDTSMVPNAQELVNSSLHFAEVVAALGVLARGGSMLWKGFTLFEHTSLCALYLMGAVFDDVTVCKPCTSKACNSEVYVVGRGFQGLPGDVLEMLLSKCGEDTFSGGVMLSLDMLPPHFTASVLDAAAHFARCTSEAIRDALDKSGLPSSGPTGTAIRRVKERFAAEWFHRMDLVPLERRFFVAPFEAIDGSNNSTSNVLGRRRELLGTLQERQEQYRRRRNDLGLDGGAIAAAAVLQSQLGSSYGSVECNSLGTSPIGASLYEYGRSPVRGLGYGGGGDSGQRRDLGLGARGVPPSIGATSAGKSPIEGRGDSPTLQVNSTIVKMMAKMGYKEGAGLGRHGQGIAEAVPAVGNAGRAGLGLSAAGRDDADSGWTAGGLGLGMGLVLGMGLGARASSAEVPEAQTCGLGGGGLGLGATRCDDDKEGRDTGAPAGLGHLESGALTGLDSSLPGLQDPCWAAAPDTKVLVNHLPPLSAAEVAGWAASASAAAAAAIATAGSGGTGGGGGGSSTAAAAAAVAASGASLGRQVAPAKLTKSKMIIDDHVLVALRRVRDAYSAQANGQNSDLGAAASAAKLPAEVGNATGLAAAVTAVTPGGGSTVVAEVLRRKVCRHVGPLCVAPRRRGVGIGGRSFWKLASLDAALSVCRLAAAAAAASSNKEPRALDLSLHSAGATDYLLNGVNGVGPQARGRVSGSGVEAPGVHRQDSNESRCSRDSSKERIEEDLEPLVGHSSCSSSSQSLSEEAEQEPECTPACARRIVAAGAAASNGDRAAWRCVMLETRASEEYLQGLEPHNRQRVALQRLAGVGPEPLADADPLDLFTLESSRRVAQAGWDPSGPPASASNAEAQPGIREPPWGVLPLAGEAATRQTSTTWKNAVGCHLVVGDLSSLRRARCGSPPSSRGALEGEYDTLYRRRLLWEAATALATLVPGGCAVLRLGDCLTMFTVSVLYVLHRSFEKLAVIKPFASCACSPERFVVAVGLLEDGGVAAAHLLAGLAAVRDVETPVIVLEPQARTPAVLQPTSLTRREVDATEGGTPRSTGSGPEGPGTSPSPSVRTCEGRSGPAGSTAEPAGAGAAVTTVAEIYRADPPDASEGTEDAEARPGSVVPSGDGCGGGPCKPRTCAGEFPLLPTGGLREPTDGSPASPTASCASASICTPAPSESPCVRCEAATPVHSAAGPSVSDLQAVESSSPNGSPSPGPTPSPSAAAATTAKDATWGCQAMAITGVTPLSICVAGEFYVYLAARTQELAKRQVRACEAALAAAGSGAGERTAYRGVASGLSAALEAQYVELARRADEVLASGGGLDEEGKGVSPVKDEDTDLRLKYGGIFTRGQSTAFTVGPAPVSSSCLARAAAPPPKDLNEPEGWPPAAARTAGLGYTGRAITARATVAAGPASDAAAGWGSTGTPATKSAVRSGCGNAPDPEGARPYSKRGCGDRGGAGLGRQSSAGSPGLWTSRWRPPSSYGCSPPSGVFTPSETNTPSGASTPYGTSPPYGKGGSYLNSPPTGEDGFASMYGRSPPPQYGSSWHGHMSGSWGRGHGYGRGQLSCSWDRSGEESRGGGRGLRGYGHAQGSVAEAAEATPDGHQGTVKGSSGKWDWGSKKSSRKQGANPPAANVTVGSAPTRESMRGPSWRSDGRKEREKAVVGHVPVGSAGGKDQQEPLEDGWERVVTSSRRRGC